jgi:hypothetical protein
MRPGFFIESPPHGPLRFSQATLDPEPFRRPWLLPRLLPQHRLEHCGQPRFQQWWPATFPAMAATGRHGTISASTYSDTLGAACGMSTKTTNSDGETVCRV